MIMILILVIINIIIITTIMILMIMIMTAVDDDDDFFYLHPLLCTQVTKQPWPALTKLVSSSSRQNGAFRPPPPSLGQASSPTLGGGDTAGDRPPHLADWRERRAALDGGVPSTLGVRGGGGRLCGGE